MFLLFVSQKKLSEKWTWMKCTPLKFLNKKLRKNEIIVQAILGTIIGIIIIILG